MGPGPSLFLRTVDGAAPAPTARESQPSAARFEISGLTARRRASDHRASCSSRPGEAVPPPSTLVPASAPAPRPCPRRPDDAARALASPERPVSSSLDGALSCPLNAIAQRGGQVRRVACQRVPAVTFPRFLAALAERPDRTDLPLIVSSANPALRLLEAIPSPAERGEDLLSE